MFGDDDLIVDAIGLIVDERATADECATAGEQAVLGAEESDQR